MVSERKLTRVAKKHALKLADKIWGRSSPRSLVEAFAELQETACIKPEPADRRWYVLRCEPQQERSAAGHLIGRRFKTYLPEIPRWTTRGVRRKKVQVMVPMFPGYLFVRLGPVSDRGRWGEAASTPGIHSFMRLDDSYAIVSDNDMKRVLEVEQGERKPKEKARPYARGETIRIGEGPFTGFNAQIIRLEEQDRITVLLNLLGRATPVSLESSQIEKL